jgi:Fic family protein
LRRELERFTIELSWKSSQIEGNTYSLLETEELIKNRKEAKGHDKSEAIMILNHKSAFDTILEKRDNFKKIDILDIRSIHSELVKGLEIKSGIRESGVGITGTKYLPLDNKWQIEEALNKLVDHTYKINYIPEKALIHLAMIAYLQPFTDGNKRTSRMISNAILLTNGYFPLSYRSVDEVEYKKALILFYEQNNIYHLKRIFLEQQQFAIDNYFL